jgi:hypothetical protein
MFDSLETKTIEFDSHDLALENLKLKTRNDFYSSLHLNPSRTTNEYNLSNIIFYE